MRQPEKKKRYVALPRVKDFMETQLLAIRDEYDDIVRELEINGRLSMPTGEKLKDENLYAIRIIQAGNVRVFYVYGHEDKIYGIHGYVKKTQHIPGGELNIAKKIVKLLRKEKKL